MYRILLLLTTFCLVVSVPLPCYTFKLFYISFFCIILYSSDVFNHMVIMIFFLKMAIKRNGKGKCRFLYARQLLFAIDNSTDLVHLDY